MANYNNVTTKEVDPEILAVVEFFKGIIDKFIEDNAGQDIDVKTARRLFNIGKQPRVFNPITDSIEDLQYYVLNNTAIFAPGSRQDGIKPAFKRISCHALITDYNNTPVYFVDVYINSAMDYGILVIPQDEYGPVHAEKYNYRSNNYTRKQSDAVAENIAGESAAAEATPADPVTPASMCADTVG